LASHRNVNGTAPQSGAAGPEWIPWIDVMKGIGIVAVVVGHIWGPAHDYIFWFHIPLFFYISGYLYRPAKSSRAYLLKKARHLLVPYLSFLIVLSLPEYLNYAVSLWQGPSGELLASILIVTAKRIFGGRALTVWFAVFWFVTCLFLTQQIYNEVHKRLGAKKKWFYLFLLSMYVLAMVNSFYFSHLKFPWNLNVVALAITYYHVGHMSAHMAIGRRAKVAASSAIVMLAVVMQTLGVLDLQFAMKSVHYGVPVFSFFLAISCIFLVEELAKGLSIVDPFLRLFAGLGQASMVIMYLHWAIQAILQDCLGVSSPLIRIIASLCISFLVYKSLGMSSLTRQLFLGIPGPARTGNAPGLSVSA
jgi:fucose 4-O-acetylase-like acetyltransferase